MVQNSSRRTGSSLVRATVRQSTTNAIGVAHTCPSSVHFRPKITEHSGEFFLAVPGSQRRKCRQDKKLSTMASLQRTLRLSRRLPSYHHSSNRSEFLNGSTFRYFSAAFPSSTEGNESSSTCSALVETNPDISLPSLFDSANLTDAVDKSLTTFLATSIHTPAHEVPWWDCSVYIIDAVHMVHDVTGLSYAFSIASVTVVGRLLMVPIGIWHLRNNPYEPTVAELRRKFDQAHDPVQKARYKAELMAMRDAFPRINRFALPAASMGTIFFMWLGLRRMSTLYPEEMATGGMAWFTDLTQPDPFLFLPVMSTVLFYSMRELGADEMGRPRQQIQNKFIDYSFKALQGVMVVVWFVLPASIMCFWIPNSSISCLQSVIFSQPAVIKALGFGHAGKKATVEDKPTVYDLDLEKKHKAKVQQVRTAPIRIKKGIKKQSQRRR